MLVDIIQSVIILILGVVCLVQSIQFKNLKGYAEEERSCRHFAVEKLSKTMRNWDSKLRRRIHILERKVRHINKGPVQIPESLNGKS